MSQVLSTIPGPVAGFTRQLGLLAVQVALTADTYTTGTGGLPVDLTSIFAANAIGGNPTRPLKATDVVYILAQTTDGYVGFGVLSSGNIFNVRLFTSGASEIANGALTKTLNLLILFA